MEAKARTLGPVNLGNPSEVSMYSLAETVIEMTGSSSSIKFLPLPTDDPKQRRPDVTLAKRLIDWQAPTDLRTGLFRTITQMQYDVRRHEHRTR